MNARQRRKAKRAALRKYRGHEEINIGFREIWDMPVIGNCVMPIILTGRTGPRWWQKKKR